MADPFSDEIRELLKTHFEHLTSSAISIDVIRERGYRTIMGKKSLADCGFSKTQQLYPGILIPLHGVGGDIVGYQYLPDQPRIGARERAIKYENPAGSSVRLDVPPRCRPQIGDPSVPLWITEGIKKVDALATAGACVIGLTGVWGFKGKNMFGGTTFLADFDYIAFKDRLVYLVFDSDSQTNPHVAQALSRLAEHLSRKGATVIKLQLPVVPGGEKTGADDYLAQGHTLEDFKKLEVVESVVPKIHAKGKYTSDEYVIESGRLCWNKPTNSGPVVVPLCNFTAKVTADVLRDNGLESARYFKVNGKMGDGQMLPEVEIPSTGFNAMSWVTGEWGMRAIIAAGQTHKDRLREAIQLLSQDATQSVIYTHTGWREIDGEMTFLSGSGAPRP